VASEQGAVSMGHAALRRMPEGARWLQNQMSVSPHPVRSVMKTAKLAQIAQPAVSVGKM
jgi:hypothetical protein